MHRIYVDLETTGLDPHLHDIVEVAWAREDGPLHRFVPEHTLDNAEPMALEINRYHERRLHHERTFPWHSSAGMNLYTALQGAQIVGSSPSFDVRFLYEKFEAEPWHHHLFDLPLYAAGIFGWEKQQGIKKTVEHMNTLGFGLPLPDHTAAGDVHAARELHTALRKMAEVRRFVDDAVTAAEILHANKVDNLGVRLTVQEVWRRNKPRARRGRY